MEKPILGYITFYHVAIYFFVYSFLGWITEVVYHTLKTGKFVNRGFLNGPVCPIYGTGIALCVLLLNTLADKWWLLFLAGGALATGLELLTGFVLDKIFKTKWWDYSKEPFNVKGYVCLRFALIWGVAVLLVFNTLVPLTNKLAELIPYKWWGFSLILFFGTVMLADFITVIIQLTGLKKNLVETSKIAEIIHKDSEFIGKHVSDITLNVSARIKKVVSKLENSRIVKAFPRLKKNASDVMSEYERAAAEISKNAKNPDGAEKSDLSDTTEKND